MYVRVVEMSANLKYKMRIIEHLNCSVTCESNLEELLGRLLEEVDTQLTQAEQQPL